MTIKEMIDMRIKGFSNCKKEEVAEVIPLANQKKNAFAAIEKEAKGALQEMLDKDEQLQFTFDSDPYGAGFKEKKAYRFKISNEALATLCAKVAPTYNHLVADESALIDAYKKGLALPQEIVDEIEVSEQLVLEVKPQKSKKGGAQ